MVEKQSLVDVIIHVNTADNFKDAVQMFNQLLGTSEAPVEEMRKVQKKVSEAAKEEPKKEKSESKQAAEVEEKPKADTSKSQDNAEEVSETVSLNDIKKSMSDVVKAGKRQEAKDLLGEFGVAKVSELTEDQYSEFLEKLKQLL